MKTLSREEWKKRLIWIRFAVVLASLLNCFQFLSVVPAVGQELPATFVPIAPDLLSNSFVRCFHKDSRGYMWIGTEDGLIRYDGTNAYRYAHDAKDKTTLAHNTINAIVEGKDNRLWFGTALGLCIYNPELDNFVNVDSIPGTRNFLNNRYITDLEFDRDGKLWIGTHEGGINVYDPSYRQFTYIIDQPQGGIMPAANFINTLVTVGDTIWCSTKGGLLLYDYRTRKRLPLGVLSRFSQSQISAIVPEPSGNILIATIYGEIMRVIRTKDTYSFQQILTGNELGESSNRILALSVDQNGIILAGGENSGFNLINSRSRKVKRYFAEQGNTRRLPTNSIQSIYTDERGLVWIGTFNNGVFLLDNSKKKFVRKEILTENFSHVNNEVRGFAEDKDGNVWIAYYGAGLARIGAKDNTVHSVDRINQKLPNKNATALICDRQGDLWLSTAGKGVYRVNLKTETVTNYSLISDGFGNDQVFSLYEDKKGVIWGGTWGSGLFYYDKTTDKFVSSTGYDQPNHIPNTAYVTDIIEDSDGTFWIGTLYGLYELNRRSEHSFTYRLHLPDSAGASINGSQVQVVVEDKNKNLWVGTAEGLNLRKKGQSEFISYRMGQGAQANSLRSILVDNLGNAWIGGNNGLSKFDANTNTFINYTREDGLRSNNFLRNAALASSKGKFFFGSNNGFDSFYPDSIKTTPSGATVVLADLKINNQSIRPGGPDSPLQKHISLTSDLKLSYDQRSFAIDFVALDYGQSANYTYCYKLQGFDEEWICKGREHTATYTNMDPGTYVFLVKAANRDGVWIDAPVQLVITIQQVFWKTWWAILIYCVVVFLLVYMLIKIRVERLKLKSEIRFEKLTREREHQLSESKTQFFTNVAHEFRTPLSLILIPLESLTGSADVPPLLRKRVDTAYKNACRMKGLVNELLDFNKLEVGNLRLDVQHGELVQFIMETSSAFNEMAEKRNISFSINPTVPSVFGWFDRDKLERMLFNVLSNAFKFTADAGAIKLTIGTKTADIPAVGSCRCIELLIEDNGIGILPDELPHIFQKFYQAKSSSQISSPGTGIGLSYTKALVELHNGVITAESVPDQATIFTILLPIDAKVYRVDESVVALPDVVDMPRLDFETAALVNQQGDDVMDYDDGRPTVLVVEDNYELKEYLVAELKSEFSVLEARDGAEGLAIALDKGPDLIISDVMMPVKNGIELCDAIKSDLNTSHIPFILLTAKATVEDQIKGITTGADLYISKPFNIRFLVAHAHQIIASRRKLYARFSQDVYLMPGKAATNDLDQEFLQKAIDYVVANLQDPQLSVDSIAALFNLSRMQTYRKIKALTGKSVVEFIKMVRMKQAIKFMDTNKLTLAEIAFEVGFNSASYFTRCFKEEYGKTPSEYLEQR